MNTIPKEPIVDFKYTYGLTNDKRYYQLGTVLESSELSFFPQTYANSYVSKVVGNYRGLYKFIGTDSKQYIINLPSLIFTQSGEINLQTSTNPNFVINNGGNLVKPYDESNNQSVTATLLKLTGTGVSLTGVVIPNTEDWNTQSGSLKESLGYEIDEIWNEATGNTAPSQNNSTPSTPVTYASCNLNGTTVEHGASVIAYETTSVTFGNTCTSEQRSCNDGVLSGSFTNGSCSVAGATGTFTLAQTSTKVGEPVVITNNCSVSPTGYASSNTNVGIASSSSVLAINAGTTIITPIGGACSDTEGKTLTVTIPQWKDEAGAGCDNDDYVFTQGGVTYRWAGCNSVFGSGTLSGYEWLGNSCSNYTGGTATCGTTQMLSTAKENAWTATTGTVNNIWGKLYTYAQASATTGGACPSGWHLPNDTEWTALETKLSGSDCRSTNCPGLGWLGNASKNSSNNIIQALKIPLAGFRNINGNFGNHGYGAYLWSSSSYTRFFYSGDDKVIRDTYGTTYGFSVRCVKDQ